MLAFGSEQLLFAVELAVQKLQKDDLDYPAFRKKKEYAKQF